MTLSTEYRGYRISYSENEEVWTCYDVGASADKLSSVKRKIDTMHRKMRKENAVMCIDLSTYSRIDANEAIIVEYLGPVRKKMGFESVGTGPVQDHSVAYMSNRNSLSGKKTRQTGVLSRLFAHTPENMQRIDHLRDIETRRKALDAETQKIISEMQCVRLEDIDAIVTASGHRFTEEQNETKT